MPPREKSLSAILCTSGYFDAAGNLRNEFVARDWIMPIAQEMSTARPPLTMHQVRRFFQHCRAIEAKVKAGTSTWAREEAAFRQLDVAAADAFGKSPPKIPEQFQEFIKSNVAADGSRADVEGEKVTPADQLLPLVYDELRKLAAAKLAAEQPGQTLDATALVHEAYLRLVVSPGRESGDAHFEHRGHFFAAAAEAMRRILIDHARNRNRLKRGGGRHRVDLERLTELAAATDDDLIELDEALDRLAKDYPAAAELVKLRFFAGMSLGEAADALGLPRRTADRHWSFARAWLAQALGSE
jgi:RNA polymerase sigma factor (TIGR02999 family)